MPLYAGVRLFPFRKIDAIPDCVNYPMMSASSDRIREARHHTPTVYARVCRIDSNNDYLTGTNTVMIC
jgi:hypothetical protein